MLHMFVHFTDTDTGREFSKCQCQEGCQELFGEGRFLFPLLRSGNTTQYFHFGKGLSRVVCNFLIIFLYDYAQEQVDLEEELFQTAVDESIASMKSYERCLDNVASWPPIFSCLRFNLQLSSYGSHN